MNFQQALRTCIVIYSLSFFSKIADLQEEHQRETEGLLESVRNASKEDKYLQLVMDSYIPKEYQVSEYVMWVLCNVHWFL